ncbi:crocetin glucosyltransferase, chloroplastic-like, partial [Morus notabilis]|uniref:crocetin glucosyltransferase, chloroplastic-like n=1 Tax=Morus notabilis TaxID=981085 RepID=UPI000CED2963
MTQPPRFLLVTYPAQGHINPVLQFAKRLVGAGADVTFVTTYFAHRRMTKGRGDTTAAANRNGGVSISYVPFSDGHDDGFKAGDDFDHYLNEIRRRGSQAISDLVISAAKEGHPYTCLVYSLLLPWAALTAEELCLPSVLLWIQPATVFDIYYYYFHGYGDIFRENNTKDPSTDHNSSTTLPGLSLTFTRCDLPSFMDAANAYSFAIPLFKEQLEVLDKIKNPKILVNTFDQLELEALKAIEKLSLIAIGPLIPSAFLDGKDPSDTSFGGDLVHVDHQNYIEWLNSKPKGSIIYLSFGSMVELSRPQMEEIAKGLLDCGRPFLWVIREKAKKKESEKKNEEREEEEEKLSCHEELSKLGKIVPWCRQVEVLSSASLGCFVTHCGWNSTLESLVCGVPVVAFPQWTDQGTNAKLIEDVWKTGVRVKPNEKGMVESQEIKRCLDLVMEGEELR